MKIAILGALLLAVPASAQAPAPSFADAIGICRAALVEQIQGGDGSKALARIDAFPADLQGASRVVCAAYFIGAGDIIALQRGKPEQAKAI